MTLSLHHRTFGTLNTVVAQSGSGAAVPVILCHGYGAPGDDLVSLAEPLADWLDAAADRFSFAFPAAPLSPPELAAYGGRAWWEINMQKLLAATQTGRFEDLHDQEPPGMATATGELAAAIKSILVEFPGDAPYVLGGFSQGAMITMNAALTTDLRPPAVLVQFSGTLVNRRAWNEALAGGLLSETLVLQSHGRFDNILPIGSAETLRDLVREHGVDNHFIAFDGPHTIPMEALMRLAVMLKRL